MTNPKDLLPPTMNGGIIMVNFPHMPMLHDFVINAQLTQYSVTLGEVGVILSTPCTEAFENYATGMVHGARARAKDKEKPNPKPPTGGGNPDGTPPNGGTPGGTSVWEDLYTEARAA